MTDGSYGVRLRRARWWDRGFVLRLRNAPDSLARGLGTQPVGGTWWTLVKPLMSIVVLEWPGMTRRVGYVIVNTKCEVSIALYPMYRGLGIGTETLRELRRQHPDLVARIRHDNPVSLRAFEKAGFRIVRSDDAHHVYEVKA